MAEAMPAPPMQVPTDNSDGPRRVDRTKQVRRLATQLGPWRFALTIMMMALALLLARFSWDTPLVINAERAFYDARTALAASHVGQDQRITMVTYNDEVLIERRVRSPLDRALLADALKALDQMGAKSIGIDILFDQATDNDDILRAQLRAMQTPTFIAFAEPGSNPNNIQTRQADFLRSFVASVETARTRPASIRLGTDQDDTYRRWPGRAPGTPTLLTVAMAGTEAGRGDAFDHYHGGVRWRMPAQASDLNGVSVVPVFENLPITTFTNPDMMTPDIMPVMAELVRGRHILIGGDIIDNDDFTTPLSRIPDLGTGATTMKGLEVHAHMLAQILDDARLIPIPAWAIWLAAILAVAAGAMTALLDVRPWVSALLLLAQMALIAFIPYWLAQYGFDTLDLPVAGTASGWLLAFIGATSALRAVGAEERAFAQSALGKYLPRDIALEILADPDRLALHGEKKAIYCLFSDLEGFTKMSHAMTPENVAFVLNAYLDTLSEVVLAHGGTIDKFVGDAVVAFWGAPIARPDDAARAAQALLAMTAAGEAFSARMALEQGGALPPIGRTRVGLHYGEAVVGNFGGEGRIQYTALGDSMNTAARLESANKPMKTRALASREALAIANADGFVAMGRIQLRGRAKPVDVFEPRPDLSAKDRAAIDALVAAHDAGKGEDYARQRETVRALDIARRESIDFLIERLDATEPGGFYVQG
ncbi:MAG: adenylate/guanylate cyclase domain-containing protein [Pseudomonadota bacterium]